MDTAIATVSDTAAAPQSVPVHLKPRAIPLTFTIFGGSLIAMFVAAIVLSAAFTEADGVYIWVMVLMGAVIITALLSGVFMPFIKEIREHRKHHRV